MILGITGGSGSGKTTLLKAVADFGGLILDCDAIYHELLQSSDALLRAIEARFPTAVENGTVQRKKLGAIVFSDPQALLDLNAITHSAIKAEVLRRLQTAPALCAIDAFALFESGLSDLCDITVAVTAPRQERIRRLMARDGISQSYAQSRIDAQPSDAWYAEKCDYLLANTEDFDAFATKCVAFLHQIGIMKP